MFMAESTEEGALHHARRQSNSKTCQVWLQRATYLPEKVAVMSAGAADVVERRAWACILKVFLGG